MREIIDDKQKYLISDIETSCYFSLMHFYL